MPKLHASRRPPPAEPADAEAGFGTVRQAYLTALRLLARRELSEAQVRGRLLRRGLEPDAVEAALTRLKHERAIDDARAAEAIARTQAAIKRRGTLRIRREIEAAGIDAAVARRAVDEVFGTLDADELADAALSRRLRPGREIADDRELSRLHRYLLAQGFDTEQATRTLAKRRRRP